MQVEIKFSSITSEKKNYIAAAYWVYIKQLDRVSVIMVQTYTLKTFGISKTFGNCDCAINPLRTQGIIELHQKITKHITLSTKKQRVDSVMADLRSKKISSHRLYQINLFRAEEKAKLAIENYAKTKKRKFSHQKPPSGVKLDNINNKVSSSEPNKKNK